MTGYAPGTAAAEGLACCHTCLKVAPDSLHECPRCGSALHVRKPDSLQRTVALIVTATLLYIPANVLPIMTTTQLGWATDSTIIGGVVVLLHHGDIPIFLLHESEAIGHSSAPRNVDNGFGLGLQVLRID